MVEEIKGFEIEIDKDEVCRHLGYRGNRGPNSSISTLIDKEMDNAYQLIEPSCFYQIKEIKAVMDSQIFLEDSLVVEGRVLGKVLSRCQQAVIFLATIGSALEDRVSQLMRRRRILKATILDSIGSEAAEKTACYLQDRVQELAASDSAEITLRYSPGYCDWDITQQRVLFQAMNSAPLAVSLTEECLMVPRKSVSGIIGVGRFESKILRSSPCHFCTKRDCPSRR